MIKMTQPKLYARGNKLWVRFSLDGEVIKRSLNIEDNKVNRKLANTQIVPQLIIKINSGEFFEKDKQTVPTVDEFAKISFKLHEEHRKSSTLDRMYSNYNKHIVPYFKNKKLTAIKPSDISLWQNKLLNEFNLKPKRVKDIRTVLSVIFEDALHDEIILFNPARRASKLPTQAPPQIVPFSLYEIKLILESADEQFKNFFAVAFFTGARTGEIIGLKWEDIDFKKDSISIKRTVGKGLISTPKTQESNRTIEMLTVLKPYLKEQFKRTGKEDSFIFLNRNNTHYYDSNKIRDYSWKKTLERADIKYRTLYNTRHSFASLMISRGEDILWVSHMLGHTNTEMTLRKYAKYIKDNTKKRATFLDNEL